MAPYAIGSNETSMGTGGGQLLGSGHQLPPPPNWPLAEGPLGGGGGGSGRGWGGGEGFCVGGGGAQKGWLGGGASRWGNLGGTGSPYLPLPSLYPYHPPKPNPNLCSELVRPCQPC